MAERDAFGNLIGDDQPAIASEPFGSPFGTPDPTPAAPPPPAPSPPAEAAAAAGGPASAEPAPSTLGWAPPPADPGARTIQVVLPTRRRRSAATLTTVLVTVGAIGGGVALLAGSGANDLQLPKLTIPSFTVPSPATATAPTAPGAAPRGLSGRSLVAPVAFRRALARARAAGGGSLKLLRVAPERIDAQFARSGGGLNLVQLRWDGGRSVVRTPGSTSAIATLSSRLDETAPGRLVRGGARRLHVPTTDLDYLVLLRVAGETRWSAYFRGGGIVQGDEHGRFTRRVS